MTKVVLINGSFGVGKTTVARLVAARRAGTALFDPERIGYVLRRLPAWLPGSAKALDDYQDSPSWRRLVAFCAVRLARWRRSDLLVPMCFARKDYVDELAQAVRASGLDWVEICLTAELQIIYGRLRERGAFAVADGGAWLERKAAAACAAHAAPGYGIRIATDRLMPDETAARVLEAAFADTRSGVAGAVH
ncbi:MAG: AAA family ATPase [Pseudomonadales bacterium]